MIIDGLIQDVYICNHRDIDQILDVGIVCKNCDKTVALIAEEYYKKNSNVRS